MAFDFSNRNVEQGGQTPGGELLLRQQVENTLPEGAAGSVRHDSKDERNYNNTRKRVVIEIHHAKPYGAFTGSMLG